MYRSIYKTDTDIEKSAPHSSFSTGDWIWWPYTEGHVGVVIDTMNGKVMLAYEPLSEKTKLATFVAALAGMNTPVRSV